jgi:long-chain acyl-CoA synthetase
MDIRTLPDLLDERAGKSPGSTCYEQSAGNLREMVTWSEFKRRADALSLGLADIGVKPGDCVAVMGQTTGEWAISDFGILGAGAVSVGVYTSLTASQIAYLLNDCKAKVAIVGSREDLRAIREAQKLAPGLTTLIGWGTAEGTGSGVLDFSALLARGRGVAEKAPKKLAELRQARQPNDVALIIYTSGTTGVPKGAMLSHGNCVFMVKTLEPLLPADFNAGDITVSFLPMAHVAEHCLGFFGRVNTGMATRYVGSLDSQTVLTAVQQTRPTVFGSVPRIFEKAYAKMRATVAAANPRRQAIFAWAERTGRAMSKHILNHTTPPLSLKLRFRLADRLVLSKIRGAFGGRVKYFVSGAAPIDPEILEFFHACGMTVLEAFGQTECTGICTVNRYDNPRFGTVGTAIPGVEIRTASDGEILVRGAGNFLGYLNQPEATKEALDSDGWLHTGDIGEIDKDGFVRITDRKKNLIVTSGGKKVAPAAIEALLTGETILGPTLIVGESRPCITALLTLDVDEARAATGLKQASVAELARHPQVQQRAQAAVAKANSQLARYEQIRRFRILDKELVVGSDEMTPTMKLRRKAVSEKFSNELASLYAQKIEPGVFEVGDVSPGNSTGAHAAA